MKSVRAIDISDSLRVCVGRRIVVVSSVAYGYLVSLHHRWVDWKVEAIYGVRAAAGLAVRLAHPKFPCLIVQIYTQLKLLLDERWILFSEFFL